jgi:hypothetical protein
MKEELKFSDQIFIRNQMEIHHQFLNSKHQRKMQIKSNQAQNGAGINQINR